MTKNDYFAREAEAAYELHGHKCLICGKQATQLAHRIPQRTSMLDRYGWRVIHSRHNRLPACSTCCNGQLQCKAQSEPMTDAIAKEIMSCILQEER